jgi:hypothetical protein
MSLVVIVLIRFLMVTINFSSVDNGLWMDRCLNKLIGRLGWNHCSVLLLCSHVPLRGLPILRLLTYIIQLKCTRLLPWIFFRLPLHNA